MTRHRRRLNPRQLVFARAIAEGKSDADAQCIAGYLPNRKNKNILLDDPRIQEEIARLRGLIDAEWARQQCELRLLTDPRVIAHIDAKAAEIFVEWHRRHGDANRNEPPTESSGIANDHP